MTHRLSNFAFRVQEVAVTHRLNVKLGQQMIWTFDYACRSWCLTAHGSLNNLRKFPIKKLSSTTRQENDWWRRPKAYWIRLGFLKKTEFIFKRFYQQSFCGEIEFPNERPHEYKSSNWKNKQIEITIKHPPHALIRSGRETVTFLLFYRHIFLFLKHFV